MIISILIIQWTQFYFNSLEERPDSANNREEFGHWEIDTLIGKRSSDSVLVTLTERKTRFGMIFVIPSKESSYVRDLFIKLQRK
ncbi:hypothetical protein [Caldicellulosiruptor acetigenus]|uniref:hypothetical protein n=1 Tax=Caldicellulosiruptor acetigenus TaxID=301953 RepID=UPI0005A076A0